MVYNGYHYDVLVLASSPRAKEDADVAEFNPRTKRGKMIVAAAQKLVEINHRGSKFFSLAKAVKLRCGDCGERLTSQQAAMQHAQATGHTQFSEEKVT